MPSTKRNLILIFLLTVLARIVFYQLTGFTTDDAFITFRYAENIAQGYGFVYNIGEHVLGTSTPLFTLILASFAALGMTAVKASLFISAVFSGLTAMVLYRFAQLLRFRWASWLPVMAYILFPRSLTADISGMETAFFTLLVTSAFYYQHKRLEIYAIGMATLATLTRPEGLWLLGLLLVYNWYKRPDRWFSYVLVPAILLVPWVIFAEWYFGSVVPNSVTAKLALYSQFGRPTPWQALRFMMAWHSVFGWILFVSAVIGGWWLNRKQNFCWPVVIWFVGTVLFYMFSRTMLFFWYIVPIYPMYLLFATAAAPFLIERYGPLVTRLNIIKPALYGLVILVLLAADYVPVTHYRKQEQILLDVHRQIGIYLNAEASENQLVAAEDIGYIGYYSRRRILDRDGLISPEVIPYNRAGKYLQVITDFQPSWVVASATSPISGFVNDSLFLAKYARDTSFAAYDVRYLLFSRKVADSSAAEQSLDKPGL